MLRDVITQIRSSSIKYNRFKSICEQQNNRKRSINIDNVTRWSSSFNMVTKALKLRLEIITWCVEEDLDASKQLSDDDWQELSVLGKILEVFADMSTFMQGQEYPTFSSTIPAYNVMFDALDDAEETYPENQSICRGFEKLKKYCELSDDCRANYIATILNPNQKLKFYDDNDFEDNEKNHIKNLFSSNFIYLVLFLIFYK